MRFGLRTFQDLFDGYGDVLRYLISEHTSLLRVKTGDAVLFIHFVAMGEDKEIQRITHGGQEWQRQPDESEQALKDRAQQESKPNPHGATVLRCY